MYWFNSWSSCSNLVSRLSVILELPFIIKLEIPLTLSCIKFLISWMPGFLFSDFLPHLGGEHPLAVFWGRVHGRHYFWDLVCVRWFSIISSHFLNSLAEYKIIEWRSSLPWLSGFLTHFSIVSALQCSYWEVWCYSFFFFKLFTQGNVFDSFIYLWLCWIFVSVRGLSLVVASGGHSSSRCAGLSLSWSLLLRSTGSRRTGSVIVAHGPICSAACGIFPDRGSNPCSLHWQADSQPLYHQGSPLMLFLFLIFWVSVGGRCFPSFVLVLGGPFNLEIHVLVYCFNNFPSWFLSFWSFCYFFKLFVGV